MSMNATHSHIDYERLVRICDKWVSHYEELKETVIREMIVSIKVPWYSKKTKEEFFYSQLNDCWSPTYFVYYKRVGWWYYRLDRVKQIRSMAQYSKGVVAVSVEDWGILNSVDHEIYP